ncbi:MAG: Lrp/AsnC family transcriptional regulator [Pseudomonadota bacterium]
MELSRNDRRLIAALQRDARKTVSDLARELDLSRTTAKKRLAQLEANGIIAGYHLKLGEAYRGASLQAYVNLEVDPRASRSLVGVLENMPEIEALYTVSGKVDMVAVMRVQRPDELDAALDRIGELEGVRDTDSNIVLSTRFDRR